MIAIAPRAGAAPQARAPRPLRTGGTRNHSDEIVGVT